MPGRSAVGQEVFFDIGRITLEQDGGATIVADLLVGPLDHAVTLASMGVNHLAASRHFEPLFRGRLRLHLGHLALLQDGEPSETFSSTSCEAVSSPNERKTDRHGSPFEPGRLSAGSIGEKRGDGNGLPLEPIARSAALR